MPMTDWFALQTAVQRSIVYSMNDYVYECEPSVIKQLSGFCAV